MSDRRVAIEIMSREGVSGALLVPSYVRTRPVQLGSTSELLVARPDVAPLHLMLLVRDDRLLVASVHGGPPAFTEAGEIPTTWTELALPAHVLVGETVLHLFWMMPFVGPETPRRIVRKKTPTSVPLVRASAPPRRAAPPPRSPVAYTSETKLLVANIPVPRAPPAPSPPRRAHALTGLVIDETPAFPPPRPSSPTLITDLGRRAGVKRITKPPPLASLFGSLATLWKRIEAFLSPRARVPRSP